MIAMKHKQADSKKYKVAIGKKETTPNQESVFNNLQGLSHESTPKIIPIENHTVD